MTINPPQGEESTTPLASDVCSDVTTLARLSIHVKDNNIAYLIGSLVAYQMGLFDKVFQFGTGMC
jgi:hypothetical protein